MDRSSSVFSGMDGVRCEPQMIYQLTWKILPGMKGMSCSEFHATPTNTPNNDQGVAFECLTEAECAELLLKLEAHFGAQRFSNNASAFETVKTYVLERMTRK